MKRGDQVFILCTVHDTDDDGYTMMVTALIYRQGVQVGQMTQMDVLVRSEK